MTTLQIVEMIEILPEEDKSLLYELIKKMVLAWDPDYTKLTSKEYNELETAEKQLKNGDIVDFENINWE
ncbi:hypothetical protein EII17_13555 [Clostridiales bacterium COT073_COT-073]|nr:hypothetical protein EII17_13555 [Clostridiales bacterium COT073_COT-073]